MGTLGILLQIAVRNLFSSFINVIIGGILLCGTVLVVTGSSLLDSLDSAMSRSITGSLAGHVQVYSSRSKDELSLYGGMGGDPDIWPMEDFSKTKELVERVDNVRAVVPMGTNTALITSGNVLDVALEKLRAAVRRRLEGETSEEVNAEIQSRRDHIRQTLRVLQDNLKSGLELADPSAVEVIDRDALGTAASEDFWLGFDKDPLPALEFLENRIAPLVPDSDLIFIRYVGTDLDRFREVFSSLEIVDGAYVPSGKRGLVLGKLFYEERFKLRTARRLDKIHEGLAERGKRIAEDAEFLRYVDENKAQTKEIVLQLDTIRTNEAVQRLQKFLGSEEPSLPKLLEQFMDTNDENFEARYRAFYELVAPLLELYQIRVGDTMTLKSFTRSGFVQAVNVKLYGTFQFKGLEKSALAAGLGLVDLASFRELYGYLTPEKLEEIRALRATTTEKLVNRQTAEEDLFGSADVTLKTGQSLAIDEASLLAGGSAREARDALQDHVYTREEIEKGVALNAAVVLKDPGRLKKTVAELNALFAKTGAELKAVTWQDASGLLGQFVVVSKLVLYFAVFIIFIVAMVIINNAVMMATLQRIREIGTVRAIGAQRTFVLSMVLVETVFLGLGFGALGAGLGSGIMAYLGKVGIAAPNDQLYFFFGGPRLFPVLGASNLGAAFITVLAVSVISTLYPAYLATRVSPLQAMQTEE